MPISTMEVGPGALSGHLEVPPSKSLLHRGMICAALAGDESGCVVPANPSRDIVATRSALASLFSRDTSPVRIDCGESGTTLRLLVPLAAALGRECVFVGGGRLPLRPMQPYFDSLDGKGVTLRRPSKEAWLPLEVSGKLRPDTYVLPGNVSSQFVSGLLLALPLLDGVSRIELSSPLESRPYVDLTLSTMQAFGVKVLETDSGWEVSAPQRYRVPAKPFVAEQDASQIAFWSLAKFLGSDVYWPELSPESAQGDAIYPSIVSELASKRKGDAMPEIDVSQIPDLVPALAAAAAWSATGARFVKGGRLRLKESDRISTTCAMLRAFGCQAVEEPEGLIVPPGPPSLPSGEIAEVDGANDHRIVMSAAMLATRTKARIHGAEAVAKSYPDFFSEYRRLGGTAAEV